jgi:hypothetical protein
VNRWEPSGSRFTKSKKATRPGVWVIEAVGSAADATEMRMAKRKTEWCIMMKKMAAALAAFYGPDSAKAEATFREG